jgi:hypothetical protein
MQAARDFAPSREDAAAPLRLPPIAVRTDSCAIAAFRRETDALPNQNLVPLTFPFCWLALPSIRAAIREMIGDRALPVHEAQNFAYERSLESDSDYLIAVELRREENPSRLLAHAAVLTPQGEICLRMETVLRLVPSAAEPAP